MTLECAGNGRALLSPRANSQPWLLEAVGTAEWTGTPLAPLLDEAGLGPGALEIVFTGLDRGIQGEIEHLYERSLPLSEALRDEVLLAYAINGQDLPPQHGFPLRLVVPGWYGMTHVKWLQTITAVDEPFRGFQQDVGYHFRQSPEEQGRAVTRILPRSLMVPPGIPDFPARTRFVRARLVPARRTCMVGSWADRQGRGERWMAATAGRKPNSETPSPSSPGTAGVTSGKQTRASTSSAAGPRTARARRSRSPRSGTTTGSATTPSSACAWSCEAQPRRAHAPAHEYARPPGELVRPL